MLTQNKVVPHIWITPPQNFNWLFSKSLKHESHPYFKHQKKVHILKKLFKCVRRPFCWFNFFQMTRVAVFITDHLVWILRRGQRPRSRKEAAQSGEYDNIRILGSAESWGRLQPILSSVFWWYVCIPHNIRCQRLICCVKSVLLLEIDSSWLPLPIVGGVI